MEKPVQVALAATEPAGQFADREVEHFIDGDLVKPFVQVTMGTRAVPARRRIRKFGGEDHGGHPQEMAPVPQLKLSGDPCQEPSAFLGNGRGHRKKPRRPKAGLEILQEEKLLAGEQGIQVFQAGGKPLEFHLPPRADAELAAGRAVQDKNVSPGELKRCGFRNANTSPTHREHKRESLPLVRPFLGGIAAGKAQAEIIVDQHRVGVADGIHCWSGAVVWMGFKYFAKAPVRDLA